MINLPEISKIQTKESSKINLVKNRTTKAYEYFSIRIPKNYIENIIKPIKDERFLFFIKYGILRRYEGECDIIYVEIPQIPRKLVIYRRPHCRMKSLNKLSLSNRDLPHIPLFEGEDNLKFLSLELNRITKIERLISLNNLIYLNLYGNYITEIENLSHTSKLKVLLLGKNNIEKIKNLNCLTDLEILDLHSNKIKTIENISKLQNLRILNLANNKINSFNEIIYNRNLEELNVRKNLIEIIPNMDDFQMLKKINIGKNFITKIDYILEFIKLKYLQELIIEDNPILNDPDIIIQIKKFNLPLKGKLINTSKTPNPNKRKDTRNFSYEATIETYSNSRNNNLNLIRTSTILEVPNKIKFLLPNNLKKKIKKSSVFNNTPINNKDFIYAKNSNNLNENKSLEMNMITPSIKIINSSQNSNRNQKNTTITDFYSKILPIRQLWNYEMINIKMKGYNGYVHKKCKEINIVQGHVEIDSNHSLQLYGNCLKVLEENELYEKIKSISFNYFYFDFIMSKRFLKYLKEFKNLETIKFFNNNIYSLYQLTRLESLENISNLSIFDNEICNANLLKYFIFYRLNTLKSFNNQIIKDSENKISQNIFNYFDEVISIKEKEKEKRKEEDKKVNMNINNKRNDINNENENYTNEEYKYEFFNYVKYNLSISIEEIINDEENDDI
jgi:hypothetical protein